MAETTAPVDYDGFGTFTIHAHSPQRWVLIEQEHVTWQTQRYASGLYPHKIFDEDHMIQGAIKHLWARLTRLK
jgi:hypothetical protein